LFENNSQQREGRREWRPSFFGAPVHRCAGLI